MSRMIICSLLLAAWLFACSNKNEPLPSGSLGKYDFSAVDRYLENNMAAYNGHVAVLIAQDGQLIYKREINLDSHTALPVASASKWLSAAVIMSLIDARQLSLDDSVGKYLPIFSRNGKGSITIRQLFSHTAGFEGDQGAANLAGKYEYRRNLTLAQAVDSIAVHTSLINKPGSAFNYGSTSMQIGGRIAEVVSGRRWQQLFNEKIGQPCHLTATCLTMSTDNPLIAGGVHTTAADYLNFLKMIAARGTFDGKQVLSAQAVQIMTSDQTQNAVIQGTPYPSDPFAPIPMAVVRYGMGNWLDVLDGSGNVVESSSPGLFGTHPWQDSEHHIAGIIFTRTRPKQSQPVSLRIRQLVRDVVDHN